MFRWAEAYIVIMTTHSTNQFPAKQSSYLNRLVSGTEGGSTVSQQDPYLAIYSQSLPSRSQEENNNFVCTRHAESWKGWNFRQLLQLRESSEPQRGSSCWKSLPDFWTPSYCLWNGNSQFRPPFLTSAPERRALDDPIRPHEQSTPTGSSSGPRLPGDVRLLSRRSLAARLPLVGAQRHLASRKNWSQTAVWKPNVKCKNLKQIGAKSPFPQKRKACLWKVRFIYSPSAKLPISWSY